MNSYDSGRIVGQPVRYRWVFAGLAVLGLVLATGPSGTARADVNLNSDQVKVMLHTATPEEDGFIDRTLAMVQEGHAAAGPVPELPDLGPPQAAASVPVLQAGPDPAGRPGGHHGPVAVRVGCALA